MRAFKSCPGIPRLTAFLGHHPLVHTSEVDVDNSFSSGVLKTSSSRPRWNGKLSVIARSGFASTHHRVAPRASSFVEGKNSQDHGGFSRPFKPPGSLFRTSRRFNRRPSDLEPRGCPQIPAETAVASPMLALIRTPLLPNGPVRSALRTPRRSPEAGRGWPNSGAARPSARLNPESSRRSHRANETAST